MPDRLTLEEAKTECEIRRLRCLDASTDGYNPAAACAWQDAKAILNRVKTEPDKEGQAVLWLMRHTSWDIQWLENCWKVRRMNSFGTAMYAFSPVEDAKKLGWGGGE